jgi:predicted ester cyclase
LVAELEWEGTHRGPLDTPFGIVPATNQRGSVNAVLISTFKDGKIVASRHYFDQMTVLMQVRAAPTAEAPRPAAQPYH